MKFRAIGSGAFVQTFTATLFKKKKSPCSQKIYIYIYICIVGQSYDTYAFNGTSHARPVHLTICSTDKLQHHSIQSFSRFGCLQFRFHNLLLNCLLLYLTWISLQRSKLCHWCSSPVISSTSCSFFWFC